MVGEVYSGAIEILKSVLSGFLPSEKTQYMLLIEQHSALRRFGQKYFIVRNGLGRGFVFDTMLFDWTSKELIETNSVQYRVYEALVAAGMTTRLGPAYRGAKLAVRLRIPDRLGREKLYLERGTMILVPPYILDIYQLIGIMTLRHVESRDITAEVQKSIMKAK